MQILTLSDHATLSGRRDSPHLGALRKINQGGAVSDLFLDNLKNSSIFESGTKNSATGGAELCTMKWLQGWI